MPERLEMADIMSKEAQRKKQARAIARTRASGRVAVVVLAVAALAGWAAVIFDFGG